MRLKTFKTVATASLLALASLGAGPVLAEIDKLVIANQTGLTHLPLMVMKENKLIEKAMEARGLPVASVEWITVPGSAAIIDGLMSNSIHVASTGVASTGIFWEKTRGRVKAIGGQSSASMRLMSRLPNVESVKDLPLDTKIAVPAIGTSPQALFLKMAALKHFGKDDVKRFDEMTVTMGHPDAFAAIMTPGTAIDTHFAAPPFDSWELEKGEGLRLILDSDEVTDGPATCTVLIGTEDFRSANPQTQAAIYAALVEAVTFIKAEPRAAAEIYLHALNNTRDSIEETEKLIADPRMGYDVTPRGTMKILGLMQEVGALKEPPADWREIYFPEAHDLNGN